MTMPTPLADFVAVGNEVDCLYSAPGEEAFQFQAQILAISQDHSQVKVMAVQDGSQHVLPATAVLQLSENALDNSEGWGLEPAEAEPAVNAAQQVNAQYRPAVELRPQLHVMAESEKYGGEWGGIILQISDDGTKLRVQWDEGGEIEIVSIEKAYADQEVAPMPALAKTASIGKISPKAMPQEAPAATASGFVVGQKVQAPYTDGKKYPALITAIDKAGVKAKITWVEDGSDGGIVEVASLSRPRGRQAGSTVAKPAAAMAGNGAAVAPKGKRSAATPVSLAAAVAALLSTAKKPDIVELAGYLTTRLKTGIISVFGQAG
jgi:hypothetical protein